MRFLHFILKHVAQQEAKDRLDASLWDPEWKFLQSQ